MLVLVTLNNESVVIV